MEVTWKGSKTEVKLVASVKHPLFPLIILGVDWIVANKTDLIVKEEKIVPVAQEIEEESVGKSVSVGEEESVDVSIQPEESFPSPIPPEPRKEKKTVTFALLKCYPEIVHKN